MRELFGDRLRILRKEKRMTQEELAKKFNTGKASISNYENNLRLPDANTISGYADFFGVSVDYILGRTDIRSLEDSRIETKDFHNFDMDELPDEAIKEIEKYIELIKLKYK